MDERGTDQLTEVMRRLRSVARPLMFRTVSREFPVSTWGTCFLVGFRGRVFALTAAHLVRDAHSESILISPVEGSSLWLSLSNGFGMIGESEHDDNEYDVIAYEVQWRGIPSHIANRARIIWLDRAGFDQWKADSYTATWFLFGYPRELNDVDYEARKVNTSQGLLAGKYVGMSNLQRSIHELHVDNPLQFAEFAGFSGAPVMALQPRLASTEAMRFCGIAISGTTASGRVHFLEAEAIADLLQIVIHRSTKFSNETLRGWATAPEL